MNPHEYGTGIYERDARAAGAGFRRAAGLSGGGRQDLYREALRFADGGRPGEDAVRLARQLLEAEFRAGCAEEGLCPDCGEVGGERAGPADAREVYLFGLCHGTGEASRCFYATGRRRRCADCGNAFARNRAIEDYTLWRCTSCAVRENKRRAAANPQPPYYPQGSYDLSDDAVYARFVAQYEAGEIPTAGRFPEA